MLLSEIKKLLPGLDAVAFKLENGTFVPEHFHLTEVGLIGKRFIDCGGTIRAAQSVSFQLWSAEDYDHRLRPERLLQIIRMSEEQLGIGDLDIEVEYQTETIGKYDLEFDGRHFLLKNKTTACLAQDQCGIPSAEKVNINLSDLGKAKVCCSPDGSCC